MLAIRPSRIIGAVCWGAVLVPPAAILIVISRYVVNIPYNDQWDVAPLVTKLHTGGFTFQDFWTPHFGHRLLFPYLIFVALAKLSGWKNTTEVFVNFLIVCTSGVILYMLLVRTLLPKRPKLLLPLAIVISALLFSGVQGNSWIVGFQLSWFLGNLFAIGAIWSVTRWPGRWWGFLVAVLAAIGTTYSLGLGQAIWPVIGVGLIAQRRFWPVRAVILWLILAAVVIAGYHYHLGETSDLRYFSRHPVDFALYLLGLLGSPLANREGFAVAVKYGICGLVGLGAVIALLWYRAAAHGSDVWASALPWLMLTLFSLTGAGITAVARVSWGLEEALQKRYTPTISLFWIGVIVLLATLLHDLYVEAVPSGRLGIVLPTSLIGIFLITSYLLSYSSGYGEIRAYNYLFQLDRIFILNYQRASDEQLRNVYYNPTAVRERARLLENVQEGPFHPDSLALYQQEFQREDAKWRGILSAERYALESYPIQQAIPTYGEPKANRYEGNVLRFVSPGAFGENFLLDLQLQNQPAFQAREGGVIDIKVQVASYVTLYWDTGHGLSEKETITLFLGPQDEQGWKHFRVFLPFGVQKVRVDVHYPGSGAQADALAVDLYRPK